MALLLEKQEVITEVSIVGVMIEVDAKRVVVSLSFGVRDETGNFISKRGQVVEIGGDDFNQLVSTVPTPGVTIYEAIKSVLWNYLIGKGIVRGKVV